MFMLSRRGSVFFALLLLPLAAFARDGVGAAAVAREYELDLRFEDGAVAARTVRRAGIEYWEGLGGNVWLGFALGYTENEGRDAARPFEAINGHYGALGMRFEAPLNAYWNLRGNLTHLIGRDSRNGDVYFETRAQETRIELAQVLRVQRFELSLGAAWRDLDYREVVEDDGVETVRHAEPEDTAGAFAGLGWRTDTGGTISMRYDDGLERGWTLRFEQTY